MLPSVLAIFQSPPVRGAWIEIAEMMHKEAALMSPPVRGAWIEIIRRTRRSYGCPLSPPVRGAWIEMSASIMAS